MGSTEVSSELNFNNEDYWALYEQLNKGVKREDIDLLLNELEKRIEDAKEMQHELRVDLNEVTPPSDERPRFHSRENENLQALSNMVMWRIRKANDVTMPYYDYRAVSKYTLTQVQKVYNRVFWFFYKLHITVERQGPKVVIPEQYTEEYRAFVKYDVMKPFLKVTHLIHTAREADVVIEKLGRAQLLKHMENQIHRDMDGWLRDAFKAINMMFDAVARRLHGMPLAALMVHTGREILDDTPDAERTDRDVLKYFGVGHLASVPKRSNPATASAAAADNKPAAESSKRQRVFVDSAEDVDGSAGNSDAAGMGGKAGERPVSTVMDGDNDEVYGAMAAGAAAAAVGGAAAASAVFAEEKDELVVGDGGDMLASTDLLAPSPRNMQNRDAGSFLARRSVIKREATNNELTADTIKSAMDEAMERLDDGIEVAMVEEWLSWEQDEEVMRRKWNEDRHTFKAIKTKHERRMEQLAHYREMLENAESSVPEELLNALGLNGPAAENADPASLRADVSTALDRLQASVERQGRRPVTLAGMKANASDITVTKIINAEQEKIRQGNADAIQFVLRNKHAENRLLRLEVVFRLFSERLVHRNQVFEILRPAFVDCTVSLEEEYGVAEGSEEAAMLLSMRVLLQSLHLLIGHRLKTLSGLDHASQRWQLSYLCIPYVVDVKNELTANERRERCFDVAFNGEFPGSSDLFSTKENAFVTSPNTASEITFGDLHSATYNQVLDKVLDGEFGVSLQLLPRLIKGLIYYAVLKKHQHLAKKKSEDCETMLEKQEKAAFAMVENRRAAGLKEKDMFALEKAIMVSRYLSSDKFSREQLRSYLSVKEERVRGKKQLVRDANFLYVPSKFKDKDVNRIFLYGSSFIEEAFVLPDKLPRVRDKSAGDDAANDEGAAAEDESGDQHAEGGENAATADGGDQGGMGDGDDDDDAEERVAVFASLINELVSPALFFKIFVERDDALLRHYEEILKPALEARGVQTGTMHLQAMWILYFIEVVYPHMLDTYLGVDDPDIHKENLRDLTKIAEASNGTVHKYLHAVLLPMIMTIIRAEFESGYTFYPFQIKLFGMFAQSVARPSQYLKEQVTAGGGKSFVALSIKKFFVQQRRNVLFRKVYGVLYISNMPPEEFGMPFEEYMREFAELREKIKRPDFLQDKAIGTLVGIPVSKVNGFIKDFEKQLKLNPPREGANVEGMFLDYVQNLAVKQNMTTFRGGVHATFDELERLAVSERFRPILDSIRMAMIVDESDYGPLPEAFNKYPKIGMSATTIWSESGNAIQYLYKSEVRMMGGRLHFPNFWHDFRWVTKELSKFRSTLLEDAKKKGSSDFRKDMRKIQKQFEEKAAEFASDGFREKMEGIQKKINGISPALLRKWSFDLAGVCVRHLKEVAESIEILDLDHDGDKVHLCINGTTTFEQDLEHFLGIYFSHPEKELKDTNSGLLMLPDYKTFEREQCVRDFISDKLFGVRVPSNAQKVTVLAQTKFEGKFMFVADFSSKTTESCVPFNESNENDRIDGRVLCLYTVDSRGGDFKLNSNFLRTHVRAAIFEKIPGAVTYYQTMRRMRLLKPGMPPRKGPELKQCVYIREKCDDLLRDCMIAQLQEETDEFNAYIKREWLRAHAGCRAASRKIIKIMRTADKYAKIEGNGYLKRSTKKDPVTMKFEVTPFERIFKKFSQSAIDLYVSKVKKGDDPSISTFESSWDKFFRKKNDTNGEWDAVVKKEFRGKFARTEETYCKFYKFLQEEFRNQKQVTAKYFDLFYFSIFLPMNIQKEYYGSMGK